MLVDTGCIKREYQRGDLLTKCPYIPINVEKAEMIQEEEFMN